MVPLWKDLHLLNIHKFNSEDHQGFKHRLCSFKVTSFTLGLFRKCTIFIFGNCMGIFGGPFLHLISSILMTFLPEKRKKLRIRNYKIKKQNKMIRSVTEETSCRHFRTLNFWQAAILQTHIILYLFQKLWSMAVRI